MANLTKIVIIGGGASGTITAIHLLHQFKTPVKIFLLEKRQSALFRGAAYSSQLDYEPLNVQAGKMSIFKNAPHDFYDWLVGNRAASSPEPVTPDSFVSRRWFGDYLSERLVAAKGKAPKAEFRAIIAEANDIELDKVAHTYKVKLSEGGMLEADHLIFATGNEPPADILNNFEKALLGKKYLDTPWHKNPFEGLKPDDNVLILGSGLTMIDHAVSLQKRKHKGKIYAFSRHGYLPLPQITGDSSYKIDANSGDTQVADLLAGLRLSAADAQINKIDWQHVINAIRDETPGIWRRFSVESKRKFLRRLKPFWEIHRHRMPKASADIIAEIEAKGKFEILAGCRKGITSSNGKIIFQFIQKTDKNERNVPVDYVINCTGPSGDYLENNNWLIKNLLAKGWMTQDDLRLGIVTGANGEIITAGGEPLLNAFAIGPLRKASEWETTAVHEIKNQAEELAVSMAIGHLQPTALSPLCKTLPQSTKSSFRLFKRA